LYSSGFSPEKRLAALGFGMSEDIVESVLT